jgi:hypothetical protein
MRKPGQLILLFGNESVHRRGRVAQRRPGSLGDLGRQHGPVEVEITAPQGFPAFPVVLSDRSDAHFVGDVAPPVIRSVRRSRLVSVLNLMPPSDF